MINVMVDLETMGNSNEAPIVSIGAVIFNDKGLIKDQETKRPVTFYKNIHLQTCLDRGLKVDADTIYWWMQQSKKARKTLLKDRIDLKEALKEFRDWIPKDNLQVWGNGSDFDNTLLKTSYAKYNASTPWKFYENRCFRTVKSSFPTIEIPKVGTHHNALDDAIYQANYLLALVKKHKLRGMLK